MVYSSFEIQMMRFVLASSRGKADYGRLKTAYSFSFGDRYDPTRMGFGALRVLNDDSIDGGFGFPAHPHDNMEIITIVRSGALQHGDSMGSGGIIKAGDVQVMSAGAGIHHSEANASKTEATTLFQLWIIPHTHDVEPRYDQKSFGWDTPEKKNIWTLAVSPDARDQSLMIHQYAFISLGIFDIATTYNVHRHGNGLFVMCISGSVRVGEFTLGERDVVEITDMNELLITPSSESQMLVIEVPLN